MNNKRGISLIVLVITIIVMIILASAIILSLSGNGVIFKTNKAKFQNDMATMKEELSVYISNKEVETNGAYNSDNLNANKESLVEEGTTVAGKTILDIIKSMDKKYIDKIEIVSGKLRYTGSNLNEIKWSDEILEGIKGNNLEEIKVEQSNTIKLENSINTNMANYRIYGNSIQNATPSVDTPIEIQNVGFYGENLLKHDLPCEQGFLDTSGNTYGNSNWPNIYVYTIPVKPSTEYVYEGCILQHITYCLYDSNMEYLGVNGGYITRDRDMVSFETTENTAYAKICTSKQLVEKNEIRLNEGTILIPYGEYNKYVLPLSISTKNLFNLHSYTLSYGYGQSSMVESFENNIWIGKGPEGGAEAANTAGQLFVHFNQSLEPNVDYTISFYGTLLEIGKYSSYLSILCESESGNIAYIANFYGTSINERKKFVITFNVDKPIERLTIRLNNNKWKFEFDTMQIEEGTAATEYTSPKVVKNIYINEPLRKIGNYADYIDFRSQEVVRNVEVVDATGTLPLEQSLRGLDTPIREKISLPNILLNEGINKIEVLTKVEPSKIEAIYYTK